MVGVRVGGWVLLVGNKGKKKLVSNDLKWSKMDFKGMFVFSGFCPTPETTTHQNVEFSTFFFEPFPYSYSYIVFILTIHSILLEYYATTLGLEK